MHVAELRKRGASYERREDRYGETKRGWWLDGVWLGERPADSLRALNGGA
jgi:hypothetical protein